MQSQINIGVVCSGGDAPGINPAIYSLIANKPENINVYGFMYGFNGIHDNDFKILNKNIVESSRLEGSSVIGCERSLQFREEQFQKVIMQNLKDLNIEHLIIFGGNGSLKATQFFKQCNISIHFIPTTIDNDVEEVETTLGFNTALNTIIESIRNVSYSAINHHKVQVYEVMGRDCPDLGLFISEAINAEFLIWKENYQNPNLLQMAADAVNNSDSLSPIIILCEKLIDSEAFTTQLKTASHRGVWFNNLGHLQRGGQPTFDDIKYGQKVIKNILKNILANEGNKIYCLETEVDI
jgi:6-phosphofructokinase 1